MRWHVYLAECADGTLYCGVATNLERRLAAHNGLAPGGAKYTRSRRPVKLAASAAFAGRSEALRAEALVKSTPRERKIARLAELAAASSA